MIVSIVIPVYNVQNYLKSCLVSVLNQTYRQIEIILVNDGATDGSGAICEQFAACDGRIKLIHKLNGGLSDARNYGVQHMTGKYAMFLDSDDVVAPDFVKIMLNMALLHQADIVECGFRKFTDDNEIKFTSPIAQTIKIFTAEQGLKLLFQEKLKQVVWNKLYSTQIVMDISFEKDRLHEDEFWTYQVLGNATKIVQITDMLYFYRQQPESIMGQTYSLRRLDAFDAFDRQVQYVQKYFPAVKEAAVLRLFWGGIYNLQRLHLNTDLDPERIHSRAIEKLIRKNISWTIIKQWRFVEIMWVVLFLVNTETCIIIRNRLKINV